MLINSLLRGAATVILMAAFATNAQAGILTITYKGTVTSGLDETGVFGVPVTDLSGASYVATYVVDTSAAATSYFEPPYLSSISGGNQLGNASPLTATLTINGVSFFTPANDLGLHEVQPLLQGPIIFQSPGQITDYANQYYQFGTVITFGQLSESIYSYVNSFIPSWNYATPFSYQIDGDDLTSGYFQQQTIDVSTFDYLVYAYANLSPTEVTVSYVPEPSAWALSALSVGLLGSLVRRRRQSARHLRDALPRMTA